MIEQQLRLEIQAMVKRVLSSIKTQNNVSAAMMEDAINSYLVDLKAEVYQEFITAITEQPAEIKEEEPAAMLDE